jgi:hypothetical protein
MARASVHRVSIPERGSFAKGVEGVMKEALLCHGPLRSWKNVKNVSGFSRRLLLCFSILFPVMEWGRGYNLGTFRHDLISGLTIGSLAIPQVCVNPPFSFRNR